MLDRLLAEHCSPVLLGKKPAALFTLPQGITQAEVVLQLSQHKNLALEMLCRRATRTLVIVYQPVLLHAALVHPLAAKTLRVHGYPIGGCLADMLGCLRQHIGEQGGFPHEVGFFLGYPPDDVVGFIEHKGQNCKHCGPWKVYGDVSHAQALFDEYAQCKECLMAHIDGGGTLASFIPAWSAAG